MKHRKYLHQCGCLSLVLILLLLFSCAAAADTAFSFRNGITWSTTPEQMQTAEGLTDGSYIRNENIGYTYFYLKGPDVYYVYRVDQLVQAYSQLPADAYDTQLEQLSALYGAPADVSADTISKLLSLLNIGSVLPGDIARLTAWRLSDGTLAALFVIGGESYMAYFHEQRIEGGV